MSTQKELLEVGSFIIKKENLSLIKINFKPVKGSGRAHYRYRNITIPEWIFEESFTDAYQYWYIIHEICHFIIHDNRLGKGHDVNFKKVEMEYLKMFGIYPIYSKAYPKILLSPSGKILYKRQKRQIYRSTKTEMIAAGRWD
jgi:hypothetical protein